MVSKLIRLAVCSKALILYIGIMLMVNLLNLSSHHGTLQKRIHVVPPSEQFRYHQDCKEESQPLGGFYQVGHEDIYMYSAFLDNRFHNPYVRMLGIQMQNSTDQLVCRYSLAGGRDHIETAFSENFPIFDQWPSPKLLYKAHIYACPVPKTTELNLTYSLSVEVTVRDHDESIHIPVIPLSYNSMTAPLRNDLAICVKGIWGSLDPDRLIEWVEFNRLLGVKKIIVYDSLLTGASVKVVNYYQQQGFLTVIPFDLARKMALLSQDDPMRHQLVEDHLVLEQAYLVSLNDCYYRYRDHFKYILFLDVDEVITPVNGRTLPEVISMADEEFPMVTAFSFLTAWHLGEYGPSSSISAEDRDLPYMQQHLFRSEVIKSQPKSAVNTDRAITVNWHGSVTIPSDHGFTGNIYLPWQKYGYVHHFRDKCKHTSDKCEELLSVKHVDDLVPMYQHQIINAMTYVSNALRLRRKVS